MAKSKKWKCAPCEQLCKEYLEHEDYMDHDFCKENNFADCPSEDDFVFECDGKNCKNPKTPREQC